VSVFAAERLHVDIGRNPSADSSRCASAFCITPEVEHHFNINLAIDPSHNFFSLIFFCWPRNMTSLKILVSVKRVIDYAVRL